MWGAIGTIAGGIIGGSFGMPGVGASVGGALGGMVGGGPEVPEAGEAPEMMDYSTAASQSKQMLQHDYRDNVKKTTEQIDKNTINRGFYGQAAGDALKQDAKNQMQADYQQNIANLATDIQQRNFNNDMRSYQQEYNNEMKAYQLEQQEYAAGQQGMGQMIGGIAQNADWGQAGDVLSNIDWGGIFGGGGSSTTSGGYQGGGTNTNQYDYMS